MPETALERLSRALPVVVAEQDLGVVDGVPDDPVGKGASPGVKGLSYRREERR